MPTVFIQHPIVSKRVSVRLETNGSNRIGNAVLLTETGVPLKRFLLTTLDNELSLEEFESGSYTLRLERGSEVLVCQITI